MMNSKSKKIKVERYYILNKNKNKMVMIKVILP